MNIGAGFIWLMQSYSSMLDNFFALIDLLLSFKNLETYFKFKSKLLVFTLNKYTLLSFAGKLFLLKILLPASREHFLRLSH